VSSVVLGVRCVQKKVTKATKKAQRTRRIIPNLGGLFSNVFLRPVTNSGYYLTCINTNPKHYATFFKKHDFRIKKVNIFSLNIKTSYMKKISFLVAGAFVCLLSAAAIIHAINFSGEWTLNKEKSVFGEYGENIAPRKITINSADNSITIERLSPTMSGEEYTTKETLTFDGKESSIVMFAANTKKSTAKWSEDGQSLLVNSLINFDIQGQMTEIKVEEVWKLTPEGQLSLQSISNSTFGTLEMKLVYDKKK
jgi:hypothetical protein